MTAHLIWIAGFREYFAQRLVEHWTLCGGVVRNGSQVAEVGFRIVRSYVQCPVCSNPRFHEVYWRGDGERRRNGSPGAAQRA